MTRTVNRHSTHSVCGAVDIGAPRIPQRSTVPSFCIALVRYRVRPHDPSRFLLFAVAEARSEARIGTHTVGDEGAHPEHGRRPPPGVAGDVATSRRAPEASSSGSRRETGSSSIARWHQFTTNASHVAVESRPNGIDGCEARHRRPRRHDRRYRYRGVLLVVCSTGTTSPPARGPLRAHRGVRWIRKPAFRVTPLRPQTQRASTRRRNDSLSCALTWRHSSPRGKFMLATFDGHPRAFIRSASMSPMMLFMSPMAS